MTAERADRGSGGVLCPRGRGHALRLGVFARMTIVWFAVCHDPVHGSHQKGRSSGVALQSKPCRCMAHSLDRPSECRSLSKRSAETRSIDMTHRGTEAVVEPIMLVVCDGSASQQAGRPRTKQRTADRYSSSKKQEEQRRRARSSQQQELHFTCPAVVSQKGGLKNVVIRAD
jgi:hypothetical protein